MTFAWTEFNKNLTFAKESRIYKSFNNLSKDSILVQYRPNLEHSLGYTDWETIALEDGFQKFVETATNLSQWELFVDAKTTGS